MKIEGKICQLKTIFSTRRRINNNACVKEHLNITDNSKKENSYTTKNSNKQQNEERQQGICLIE